MFSSSEFLQVLVSACKTVPADVIAKHSIKKEELFFRDLVLGHLAETRSDLSFKKEWRLSEDALERWEHTRPKDKKKSGRIDLVALRKTEGLPGAPCLGVEFKYWYWFDALNKSKYSDRIKVGHSILLSFLTDATKLVAEIPPNAGTSIIVTVIPTIHFDEIPRHSQTYRGEFVVERGFPSSYIGRRSGINQSEQPLSVAELRTSALNQISGFFRDRNYPTVVGGELTGSFESLKLTTDFVVSEVFVKH